MVVYHTATKLALENEILKKKLGIAINALDNIKYWKTFGIQNIPHEIVAHANAALKEIAAVATQTPEAK